MTEPLPRFIPWRRVLVESTAVVLSILLAFAIDAWWDGHQERERERVILRGILADYRASRPNLEDRLQLARRMAHTTASFRDALSAAGTSTTIVYDSLILGVIGGPTYEPATNTLDAALSSGEIELIRSDEIRALLAEWRRTLIDTTEDEVEVRRITNEQLVPLLSRVIDLGPYFAQLLNWAVGDSVSGLPGHVTMRPSSEVAGVLAMRHFYTQFAAADLAALLSLLDRTVALLDNEVASR